MSAANSSFAQSARSIETVIAPRRRASPARRSRELSGGGLDATSSKIYTSLRRSHTTEPSDHIWPRERSIVCALLPVISLHYSSPPPELR